MLIDDLTQALSASEGSSAEQLKQLKAQLLGHCRAPVKVTDEDVPPLLIAAINFAYGNPTSPEQLLSAESAKAALTAKVTPKTIGDMFIWAALASHMGTHHPKSRNDKVSSGPIVARSLTPPPAGLVTSANLRTRQFSGSGNGANTAHYQWLAFTYEDSAGVFSVIERAASQDERLGETVLTLGIQESQWQAFQEAAEAHLTVTNSAPLDRQLKQVFIPDPGQNNDFIVITPLAATAVIGAFEQHRTKLREQDANLNFHRIGVGGAKPQNAGSLMNELGGNLRQLTMTIPRLDLTQRQRRLWHLQRGRLFQPLPKKEAQRFTWWLELDWTQRYGNRQDHLQRLEQRIAEWLLPELEVQEQLFAWLSSDSLDAVHERQKLEAENLPNWILTLAGISKNPETEHGTHEARQEAAYKALTFHLKSPLSDEIDKLIQDALESLLARRYSAEGAVA
ncbi:hypothetical protein Noc_2752 [Nitrosococcus oceani ATCC 19707]|uniref:CRISPR-associated protein, Csy1 family n=2 Tax=Nitrosococcus oceani TaxID=1229 RepID=Q3J7J5_NITOC|nr:type I-F CRISPR-associated protein Csy1 [Nitrosococcus oceani]ABA59201.1 hypothetical protein Noc_2752 [Nitrosococcus oceani ATCC 19707]EDZ65592.1 hypothetical protein NOC27_2272 [Nitrosococcus oceani AFC27]KFI18371.1 hypothetical protein IB75_14625 [Nitrosococcus oceani C-27]GEM20264.1 hypothetical protein NONS58_16750 [Nitrosococcus oceani]